MHTSSYRWLNRTIPRYCGVSGSTQPADSLPLRDDGFARGYQTHATWHSSRLAPDRVVSVVDGMMTPFGRHETKSIGVLWEQAPTSQDPRVAYPEARLPPEWSALCLISHSPHIIWNREHRLVRIVSRQAWKALMESPCKGGDPRPFASELTSDSELAAAWLLFCLSGGQRCLWNGVAEHSAELLQVIWCRAFGAEPPEKVWAYIQDMHGHRLVSVAPQGWSDLEQNRESAAVYSEHFPVPGDEWRVDVIH